MRGNMAERIIVTGINGFVGKHLTRELADNGVEVVCLVTLI
jgi:nucleoside-diphosphate-sugar epimerase